MDTSAPELPDRSARVMHLSSGLRSILGNGAALAGLNLVTLVARLLIVTLIARAIGATAYGEYALALSLSMVVLGAALFGTNSILTRDHARNRGGDRASLLGAVMLLRLATAAAAGAFVPLYLWMRGADGHVILLGAVFAGALVLRGVSTLYQALLLSQERIGRGVMVGSGRLAAELTVVLLLALSGAPVISYALAYTAFWAVELAGLARAAQPAPTVFRGAARHIPGLLKQGAPLAAISSAQLFLLQSPLLLAEADGLAGPLQGALALAVQMVVMARLLPAAFAGAAIPMLARAADRGDGKDTSFYRAMALFIWLVGGLGILLAPVLAPPFIALVFGAAYSDTALFLSLGAWMLLAGALLSLMENVALVRGGLIRFCAILVAASFGTLVAARFLDLATAPLQAMALAATALWAGLLAALLTSELTRGTRKFPTDMACAGLLLAAALLADHFVAGPWLASAGFTAAILLVARRRLAAS